MTQDTVMPITSVPLEPEPPKSKRRNKGAAARDALTAVEPELPPTSEGSAALMYLPKTAVSATTASRVSLQEVTCTVTVAAPLYQKVTFNALALLGKDMTGLSAVQTVFV